MASGQFTVRITDISALLMLDNAAKRSGYVLQDAINDTVKDVQGGQQKRVEDVFEVRPAKRQFVRRQAAIIKPFASYAAGRLSATVSVGQKDRLLLSGFETGDVRKPFKGRRVAVPEIGGPARPTFSSSIPAGLEYKALRLRRTARRGRPPKGVTPNRPTLKGEQRTFEIRSSARQTEGGIYQRTGKGRSAIRIVYPFVRPGRLDRRLHFIDNARRVAATRFQQHFRRRFRETLAFRRGR